MRNKTSEEKAVMRKRREERSRVCGGLRTEQIEERVQQALRD